VVHIIPVNVSQDGGWLGGMVKKRNAIEAFVVIMLGLLVCVAILGFLPALVRVIIFFILFMLPAVVAIVGINDQSASEYVITSIKYRNANDIVPYLIQTENAPDEKLSLAQKIERLFTARGDKEAKDQMKKSGDEQKKKKPKTRKEKKEKKAERKARKKDMKIKKNQKKQALKDAKKRLKRGEEVSFDPGSFDE